jgi:ankyrin repeat protein
VKLLCEYGSDVTCGTTGQSAVEIAARNGHSDIVRTLVDFGVNIDERGSSGCPALVAASQAGFLDCMNVILSLGADVNLTDAMSFNTALHMAVRHMEPPELPTSLIKLLLSYGSDTSKKNQEGLSPLQVALSAGNFTAVTALGGRASAIV